MIRELILNYLSESGINHNIYSHQPFFSCKDNDLRLSSLDVKNLLLYSKNTDKVVLCVLSCEHRLDFKNLKKLLGLVDLEFATTEICEKVLRCSPGSISVLGLLITKYPCKVFFDEFLLDKSIQIHPCDNTYTVEITTHDLVRLLNTFGIRVEFRSIGKNN